MYMPSVLALPRGVNDSEILFDGEVDGKPAILSTVIADRFGKKHQHVLRDIDSLMSILPESFTASNIGRVTYTDSYNREYRAFLLTRDAFSLLAMGLTGKAAVIWKLRYIEAFNALERLALDRTQELAYEAGYKIGRDETLSLPVMEAERKKGYLAGMKEGAKIAKRNDKLLMLQKIHRYIGMGLTYSEIGKLLGISRAAVDCRVQRARRSGFWPEMNGRMPGSAKRDMCYARQGALLEAD